MPFLQVYAQNVALWVVLEDLFVFIVRDAKSFYDVRGGMSIHDLYKRYEYRRLVVFSAHL